jgi:hypothetical protein
LDASEVFFDVEEYALDIVANTKKAEVKLLLVFKLGWKVTMSITRPSIFV